MKYCPRCQNPLSDDAKQCNNCGKDLVEREHGSNRVDPHERRRVLVENWGLILGEVLFYIFLLRYLVVPYVIEGWMLIGRASPEYADSIKRLIDRLANFCGATSCGGGNWYYTVLGQLNMSRAPNPSPVVGVNLIAISMLIGAVGGGYLLLRIAKVLYAMWRKNLTHPTCLKARFAIFLAGVCGFSFRNQVIRHIYVGRENFKPLLYCHRI